MRWTPATTSAFRGTLHMRAAALAVLSALFSYSSLLMAADNGAGVGDGAAPAGGGAKDEKPKDEKPKDEKPKEEKPKGPEHNVTLSEESGVLDLLNKAQKARERAEKGRAPGGGSTPRGSGWPRPAA